MKKGGNNRHGDQAQQSSTNHSSVTAPTQNSQAKIGQPQIKIQNISAGQTQHTLNLVINNSPSNRNLIPSNSNSRLRSTQSYSQTQSFTDAQTLKQKVFNLPNEVQSITTAFVKSDPSTNINSNSNSTQLVNVNFTSGNTTQNSFSGQQNGTQSQAKRHTSVEPHINTNKVNGALLPNGMNNGKIFRR